MAKQQKLKQVRYVRKETFLMVTLLALAVGFFGGVVFAVFKSDSRPSVQTTPAQSAAPAASESDRIAVFERKTRANPQDAEAWTELGNAYFDSNQFEKSINAFDQAIAVDPKHEISRLNKGIVLLHDLKDINGAIEAWEGLLEVNPIAMAPNGISIDQMVMQLKKQQAGQGPQSQ